MQGRARPWLVLALTLVVLVGRVWLMHVSESDAPVSALVDYLSDIFALWFRQSAIIVIGAGLLLLLPGRVVGDRSERLGWAWATWSAFVACVPPRPGNFWANGGADDEILVYLPAAMIAIAATRLTARWPIGWPQLLIGLALLAGLAAGMFAAEGGYGADGVIATSTTVAAAAGVLAVVLHFRRPRTAPAPPSSPPRR